MQSHPHHQVMVGKLQSIFQEKDYQNPDLMEDAVIELKQAYNMVNIYSDILTGTMDAFASIISNQTLSSYCYVINLLSKSLLMEFSEHPDSFSILKI